MYFILLVYQVIYFEQCHFINPCIYPFNPPIDFALCMLILVNKDHTMIIYFNLILCTYLLGMSDNN